MIYKVWIHVEEIDEDHDHYEDVREPYPVGEFNSLEEAEELADQLETYVGSESHQNDLRLLRESKDQEKE